MFIFGFLLHRSWQLPFIPSQVSPVLANTTLFFLFVPSLFYCPFICTLEFFSCKFVQWEILSSLVREHGDLKHIKI